MPIHGGVSVVWVQLGQEAGNEDSYDSYDGYTTVVLGARTPADDRGTYHGTHVGGWQAYSASTFSPPLGPPYKNVA